MAREADKVIAYKVGPELKKSYQEFCALNDLSGVGFFKRLLHEMERETVIQGVPIMACVPEEKYEQFFNMIGDRTVGEYILKCIEDGSVPQSSCEGEIFTKDDIKDFKDICDEREIDVRFALRKAIAALRARKL